jgi:ribonuclease BN (tRNA processing enzyme)
MGDIELAFLGSGDAFGSGGRLQACLQLRGGPSELLLDCGATSLVALKRAAIDPAGIDHILVSHVHGDLFGGIPFLILGRPVHPSGAAPSSLQDHRASRLVRIRPWRSCPRLFRCPATLHCRVH